MNPCPCGYAGSKINSCECTQEQVKRYMGKISGPLLDRIDMHVEVARVLPEMLAMTQKNQEEESKTVKERVTQARKYQIKRQGKYNVLLAVAELPQICRMASSAEHLLKHAMTKFNLSARVYHRIMKVARTIADMGEEEMINERHVGEALTYRSLDRAKH